MVGVVVDLPNCSKRRASFAALQEKPRLTAFFRGMPLGLRPNSAMDFGAWRHWIAFLA
jgi:hypothetical protein